MYALHICIRYTAVEALQTLDKQKLLAPQESGNKSAKKFRNIEMLLILL